MKGTESGMRDEIRQALQNYKNLFGEEIFDNPAAFSSKLPGAPAHPIQILIISAIGGMDAYSRLKNSTSRNMYTDVTNLSKEMRKKYFIEENAAKIVIESIAELLGYTPPTDIEHAEVAIPSLSVGNTIAFGDYNWLVLDVQGDKALLITENITELRAFHPCYAGVTWEHSSLRQHLNGAFLGFFSKADKAKIVTTSIENPNNLWYGTNGGNDTCDKIFVLSLEEVDRYFGNSGDYLNKRRKEYDSGKWITNDDGWILSNTHDNSRVAKHEGSSSLWWLRSPGYSDCTVAYVGTPGNVLINGDRVCIGRGGVRPALWIKF